jgi:hypothetical protein
MTLLMRVHGIECNHYDKDKIRIQFASVEAGNVSTLFLRVTPAELAPYGLGTRHAVTIKEG